MRSDIAVVEGTTARGARSAFRLYGFLEPSQYKFARKLVSQFEL